MFNYGPLAHLVERPDVHRGGDRYMAWVYILQSLKNGRYYIGSTNNIERRLSEHSSGKTKSLKYLLPVELRFQQECSNLETARKLELKLKRYKSKVVLEKIIRDRCIMGH